MENSLSRQQEIVDWFDKTYKNRSLNYLRPVDAYRIFIELLNVQEGKKILDTACGPGQLLKAAKAKNLSLHGIDISPEAIRQCQQSLPEASVQVANAEALPFKDQTKSLAEWTQIFEAIGFEIINVYSDQWPLVRWKRWLSMNSSKIDYTKIRKGWLPLKNAYEFIFLLKKKNK